MKVYFPDAQYSITSKAESYSQLLGVKAAAVTQGTPAGRWRLGMAPPKPDSTQVQHPKRLLMADLETHLMHYALAPNCTLVRMGDLNTDLCTRLDDDGPALRSMMTRLDDATVPGQLCGGEVARHPSRFSDPQSRGGPGALAHRLHTTY